MKLTTRLLLFLLLAALAGGGEYLLSGVWSGSEPVRVPDVLDAWQQRVVQAAKPSCAEAVEKAAADATRNAYFAALPESSDLRGLFTEHALCLSVQGRNIALCDSLPGTAERNDCMLWHALLTALFDGRERGAAPPAGLEERYAGSPSPWRERMTTLLNASLSGDPAAIDMACAPFTAHSAAFEVCRLALGGALAEDTDKNSLALARAFRLGNAAYIRQLSGPWARRYAPVFETLMGRSDACQVAWRAAAALCPAVDSGSE